MATSSNSNMAYVMKLLHQIRKHCGHSSRVMIVDSNSQMLNIIIIRWSQTNSIIFPTGVPEQSTLMWVPNDIALNGMTVNNTYIVSQLHAHSSLMYATMGFL